MFLPSGASWAGEILTVANGRIRFGIRPEDGCLAELRDLRTGQNFSRAGRGLWELQLSAGGKTLSLGPSQGGRFEERPSPGPGMERRLVWRDFPPPFPPSLAVEVAIIAERADANVRWRLRVEGLAGQALTQVRFPVVYGIPPQTHERLAVPMWMGQVTSEPRRVLAWKDGQGQRSQWHYPGELSLQCLAFWGDTAGLYAASDDTAAFRKAFEVFGDDTGSIGCEVVHWPETGRAAEGRWVMPYNVLLGTFQGDWFTAAEQYRSWATNQPWAAESRLASGVTPDWITNTALWVWNRGRSDSVLGPAMALQRKLDLPVSVFWHWWHGCAYDAGFPDYLPPREGTAKFQRAVADARRRGVRSLLYMNQRLWGMTAPSWEREGAAAWAVKGPDGKIHPEIYNTFMRAPCASMCMGTAFWRNKYAGLAERAVTDLGVDGIYMDQACLSLSCYDPSHGHPLGGGTYWLNGFRLLASDIRARCVGEPNRDHAAPRPVPALAGEGCGEPWLPYLDAMLSLQVSKERYAAPDGWETIPFFHAVYHPYAVLFGNYSSLTMPPYDELWPPEFAPKEPLKLLDRKFASQFCLEQARAFVWGQQPTIANFTPDQLTIRREEIAYALRLAKLRQRASKYLLRGTLLRAPQVRVEEAMIPVSRLSIYAGQQGGLKTFEKQVPLALAAAWRAPDGQVAIAVASIAERSVPVRLTAPVQDYRLLAGAKITRIDDKGRKRMGTLNSTETMLQLELPPRGAWVLEFGAR